MVKGKGMIFRRAAYIILGLFITGAGIGFIATENKKRSQAVIKKQIDIETQKEEQQRKLEQRNKEEEQKKIEEQKKQEEQKKEEEQKKIEEAEKHKLAVKGSGKSSRIPVLMYHSIDYEKGNELRIPKEKFREQMKYLKDNGFTALSLDELYRHLVLGTKLAEKPIVITLDDGYADNYTNAFPVLKEFGFKAAVFMITSMLDTGNSYLNSEQIKEMDKNGIAIEAHTVNHPKLDGLIYSEQLKELKDSKDALEKILGREMKYFAYPYGKFNNDTFKAVEEVGYKMAFHMNGGISQISNGIYKLHRIYISDKHNMQQFKQRVNMK